MKDWLAFFLFDHRGPWQKWATARVMSWIATAIAAESAT